MVAGRGALVIFGRAITTGWGSEGGGGWKKDNFELTYTKQLHMIHPLYPITLPCHSLSPSVLRSQSVGESQSHPEGSACPPIASDGQGLPFESRGEVHQ